MAWTPTTFKARFPEFREVSDGMVQTHLEQAARKADPELFGDQWDDAVGYQAAHLITTSPIGQKMRLDAKTLSASGGTYTTLYEKEWMAIRDARTTAMRVW